MMKIIVTSIFVNDQAKALEFYTEKLGFVKKKTCLRGNLGGLRWFRQRIKMGRSYY